MQNSSIQNITFDMLKVILEQSSDFGPLQLLLQYICRNKTNWPNVKSSIVMMLDEFVAHMRK